MPNATITRSTYTAPHTITGFLDAVTTAMIAAGFTLFDSKNISGTENRIYRLIQNNSTYGTVFLRLQVTSSFGVSELLAADWNTSTNTATSAGSSTTNSIGGFSTSSNATFNFTAINHPELKGVLIVQGTNSFLLGVVRPANKESWWDENIWNYAFLADNTDGVGFLTTTRNPTSSSSAFTTNANTRLSIANSFNNGTRQVKNIEFYPPNNIGAIASTSSDLVICASSGISGSGVDEIVTANGTYLFLGKSGSFNSALAIKTA